MRVYQQSKEKYYFENYMRLSISTANKSVALLLEADNHPPLQCIIEINFLIFGIVVVLQSN